MTFGTELRRLLDGYLAAYAAQDAATCAAFYGVAGEIHSPFAPPVVGRAAIADAHQAWFEHREDNKRLDILKADARDDLAYVLLRYSADTSDGPEAGTSLDVLSRDGDGAWHFLVSSLNAHKGGTE